MTDKIRVSRRILALLAAVGIVIVGAWGAAALAGALPASQPSAVTFGTGFTYQGFLRDDAGAPLNDTCDFTFRLYDAATLGNQIGGDDVIGGVTVADGLFTVVVNEGNEFGAAAVDGGARHLDISVQCSGDGSPAALSPRQPLTAVPYARFAERFAGYENLIVVAKAGGDFSSVADAVNAIGVDAAYPAASAGNRYLVYVAPGIYENEHVEMKGYVDIEGAGRGVTIVAGSGGAAGFGPEAATLVGAGDAEVRQLTVENTGAPGDTWVFALYTAGDTAVSHVTARASGGASPRGMVAHNGGRPVLRDVALLAGGGSFSNTGLDIAGASALVDGLFANAGGNNNVHGIYINTASAPVRMENVTSFVSGGSTQTNGLYMAQSELDLTGFDTNVSAGTDLVTGIYCTGVNGRLDAREIAITATKSGEAGTLYGVRAANCDLTLRDATAGVSAPGTVSGLYFSSSITDAKTVEIDQLAIRADSGANGVRGMAMQSTSTAGATGRIENVTIQASGHLSTTGSYGLYHSARGDFQYRDLAIELTGAGSYMYGAQIRRGAPAFRDLAVDAYGDAEGTMVGLEFANAVTGGSIDEATIRVENSGDNDAVGLKTSTGGQAFEFRKITAQVTAPAGVWGYDLLGSNITATGIEAVVRGSADDSILRGMRCQNGPAEIHKATLSVAPASAAVAPLGGYGIWASNCKLTLSGSEVRAEGGSGTYYGLYMNASTGQPPYYVRDSYLRGETRALLVLGETELVVVNGQLDGGATDTGGAATATCTAVSHGSGTAFNFAAGPVACP